MSDNNRRDSGLNSRNAYIVLDSSSASNENIIDPEYNRNYLSAKPKIITSSLSASAPNLNKCTEQGTNSAQSLFRNYKKNTEVPSSSRSSLSSSGVVSTAAKGTPSPIPAHVPKIQVGMDRYVTVLKRGRSPKSAEVSQPAKILKDDEKPSSSHNRFAILQEETDAPATEQKAFKPPPIYLREKNSNDLIKLLVGLVGENNFYVTNIKRGNIFETKVQVSYESAYRKTVSELEKLKKNFYTYQLKNAKGLQVVIKGIDSYVDPEEVKTSLCSIGFKVKSVSNIRNRERNPQPLFRVELEHGDLKLKKNETHPIYDLKYFMHRRVTVEAPHKRSGPVQCLNCQEYGHTKTYCKLPSVCVVCGELHATTKCDKPKDDSRVKKCSNCGGNHTANYKGCPVFDLVKRTSKQKTVSAPSQPVNIPSTNMPPLVQPTTSQVSYANVLKSNQPYARRSNQPTTQMEMPTNEPTGPNGSRLEGVIEDMVQQLTHFMVNMTNMMQEMQKMQSALLQAVLKMP